MVGRVESAVETSGTSEKQINKLVTLKDLNGVVQVLLVDDHTMVRQGLRAILESYPDLHVVGEAADGRAGIEAVRTLRPHVVLMDVNMPVMDGIKATACIKCISHRLFSVSRRNPSRHAYLPSCSAC